MAKIVSSSLVPCVCVFLRKYKRDCERGQRKKKRRCEVAAPTESGDGHTGRGSGSGHASWNQRRQRRTVQ
jgi:hypothetical protein